MIYCIGLLLSSFTYSFLSPVVSWLRLLLHCLCILFLWLPFSMLAWWSWTILVCACLDISYFITNLKWLCNLDWQLLSELEISWFLFCCCSLLIRDLMFYWYFCLCRYVGIFSFSLYYCYFVLCFWNLYKTCLSVSTWSFKWLIF